MADRDTIDDILSEWSFDPDDVSVRIRRCDDGRDVLQMRIDLGLLQLETTGRPDGWRPFGESTYFDFLKRCELMGDGDFMMDENQCDEADREFVQFYHRRVCWLALKHYDRAVEDADHTLRLMDFCSRYSPEEDWTVNHEQFRPFVLFHRTQAAALSRLEYDVDPEAAVEELNQGLDKLFRLFTKYEAEHLFDEDELVVQLTEFRDALREQYEIGQTLQEKLADAVAQEQYELAAQLRDELAKRQIG